MEKSWLYFKAEFELVEDWQLYSWKLLMESTTETGSKEMQLKALTFGVPIPGLSSEAGKLFFCELSTYVTGLRKASSLEIFKDRLDGVLSNLA